MIFEKLKILEVMQTRSNEMIYWREFEIQFGIFEKPIF